MKPKPPFQLIVVDDRGCEVFSSYVTSEPASQHGEKDLSNTQDQHELISGIREAIENPTLDKGCSRWHTH